MRTLFVGALCALLAPAARGELITITDGHHARVNLNAERELLFTGGSIEYLNNVGGVATIAGGALTGNFDTRSRIIRGGLTKFVGIGTSQIQSFESRAELGITNRIVFEGMQLRVEGGAYRPSGTMLNVQGLMLDGSMLHMNFFLYGAQSLHAIEFIAHPELLTDPTGDGMFDLADLNIVRNNFGAEGDLAAGDIDGDGEIGLGDLNHVRNHFGNRWVLDSEQVFSGVYQFPQAVPEPSAIGLLALAMATAVGFRSGCK